jgi:hypothetical protein
MKMIIKGHIGRSTRFMLVSAILLMLGSAVVPVLAHAATLTGTVMNKTTNRSAAGEEVVLLSLTQGMQDIAHTRADSRGHYSFELPDPGMHLVRVEHQKASYYASVPAGTTSVDISIYDVGARLNGISTKAEMFRIETDQQRLHVVQSYFVENDSAPAKTQLGAEGYVIYLPKGAEIDAAEAMGPGGMPIASPPDTVGDKGGYSFAFPLRPGETRFEVSYHLPYSGSYTFAASGSLNTANLAVAIAKGMSFQASSSVGFQPFNDEADALTYLKKDVKPTETTTFTVAGSGSFPRTAQDQGQAATGQPAPASEAVAPDTKPGMGLGPPSGDPGPLEKYRWWILGIFGLLLAAGAGFLLRPRDVVASELPAADAATVPVAGGTILGALKEEMFALETERLRGTVSDGEYSERKAALDTLLKHALARQ